MRYRFIKDTTEFGKGAVVNLPEEIGRVAVKKGHAVQCDEIPVCEDPRPEPPKKRIEFLRGHVEDRGEMKITHVAGERGFFPVKQADEWIRSKIAKDFPIQSVDDNKSNAVPNKMVETLVAK